MLSSFARLFALALVAAPAALAPLSCVDDSGAGLRFPSQLRLALVPEAQQAFLRPTVEIVGKTSEVALRFTDDSFTTVEGSVPVSIDADEDATVVLRLYGRFGADTAEALLARAEQTVALKRGQANALDVDEEAFESDGAALFDLNKNGVSNLADLVRGVDPSPPGPLLDVSARTVEFDSGIGVGDDRRKTVIVENESGRTLQLTARVVGAPGMGLSRIDETGVAGQVARQLPSVALAPFQEIVLGVTFAPTSDFFVRGNAFLDVTDVDSGVAQVTEVTLVGNPDGNTAPVLNYDPAPLAAGADLLGFDAALVDLYPAASLFSGTPLVAGGSDDAPVALPLLTSTGGVIGSGGDAVPADRVFLVEVRPGFRFQAALFGLSADVDLRLIPLAAGDDVDLAVLDDSPDLVSQKGGTSPESVQLKNDGSDARFDGTTAVRALLVLTRVDVRDPRGPALDPARLSLLAQLATGPEARDLDPVVPARGVLEGGDVVTLHGAGFQSGAGGVGLSVRIGGNAALVTDVNEEGTQITAVTPAGSFEVSDQRVNVVIQNAPPELGGDGQSTTLADAFAYDPPAPFINGIDPGVGSSGGGTPITVRGGFFVRRGDRVPNVLLDGVPCTDVELVSQSELRAVTPAHPAGVAQLVVQNRFAADDRTQDSAPAIFVVVDPEGPAPVIDEVDAVEPQSGPVDGGTVLTVRGQNFEQGAVVRVGGALASSVDVDDSGSFLTCTAPARGAAGVVDVSVTNPDGQVDTAAGAFEYVVPQPVALAVTPDTVSTLGGTRVTVDGQGFRAPVVARFVQDQTSINAAVTTFVQSTRLLVTAPAGLAAGTAQLIVRNADGQDSDALPVIVAAPAGPPPNVVALQPSTLRVDNLEVITLTGTGFQQGLVVAVDDVAVATSGVSPTSLSFIPPPRVPGIAVVRLTNPDGQSDTTTLSYLEAEGAVLEAVSPDSIGAGVRGESVTVTGRNLPAVVASQLRFVPVGGGAGVDVRLINQSGNTLQLQNATPLSPGAWQVELTLAGTAPTRSRSVVATTPLPISVIVTGGAPAEGATFTLLVQGVALNPSKVRALRLSLGGDVTDVGIDASTSTASLLRAVVDTTALGLLQGQYDVSVVYAETAGPVDSVVDALDTLVIAGDCGNNRQDPGEECDGVDLAGQVCSDFGFFGGTLRCNAFCEVNAGLCSNCGDGTIQEAELEQCDGANLDGLACTDFQNAQGVAFTGGALACGPGCAFNFNGCGNCGNGIIDQGEQCDGAQLGGATCQGVGFDSGTVSCSASCQLVTATCSDCGNNRCEASETNVTCAADCVGTCGNGNVDGGETCQTCPRDVSCSGPFVLSLVSGNNQNAIRGRDLASPVVVRVRDGANQPVVGLQLTFTPPPGGDVVPRQILTGGTGEAGAVFVLPRAVGVATYTVTGTDPTGAVLSGAPLSITATANSQGSLTIETLANRLGTVGTAFAPTAPRTQMNLDSSTGASGVAVAPNGTVYIADTFNHRVLRVLPNGTTSIAVGATGQSGDVNNQAGPLARLNGPRGLAVNAQGDLFIADRGNSKIKRLRATDGIVDVVAGCGALNATTCPDQDNAPATNAFLDTPVGLAVSDDNVLYILTGATQALRRVEAGVITRPMAWGACTTGVVRPNSVNPAAALSVDSAGRVFLVGFVQNGGGCPLSGGQPYVWRLDPDGTLTPIWGGTAIGEAIPALTARLDDPQGVAVDDGGNVYVADGSSDRIRVLDGLGVVRSFAGTGTAGIGGDGGGFLAAQLNEPGHLAFAPDGDLLVVAGGNHQVRILSDVFDDTPPTFSATTFGAGQTAVVNQGVVNPVGAIVTDETGAPVTGARVAVVLPPGVGSNVPELFTDTNGTAAFTLFAGLALGTQTVQLQAFGLDGAPVVGSPFSVSFTVTDVADERIFTIVNGLAQVGGDAPGAGVRTRVNFSTSFVARDPTDGSLVFSDTFNHRVLRLSPAGALSLVTGGHCAGFSGDGAQASNARLSSPKGVAVDSAGNVYIADSTNDRVRLVRRSTGVITTAVNTEGVPGTGNFGDGQNAATGNLDGPAALAIGPDGDLFIVDDAHSRVRRVDIQTPGTLGVISSPVIGAFCGAQVRITSFTTSTGLAFDRTGHLYVAGLAQNQGGCPFANQNIVVRVEDDGSQTAVAGGGTARVTGPAVGTSLLDVSGLAVDVAGNLYIAERIGHRVRRVNVLGQMTVIAGTGIAGFSGDYGPAALAAVNAPNALLFLPDGSLVVLEDGSDTLRLIRRQGDSVAEGATLSLVSGNSQSVTFGQLTPAPLQVVLRDAQNNPLPGMVVSFEAENPGDTVQSEQETTNASGNAAVAVRLGRQVGNQHVFRARVVRPLEPQNVTGSPLTFSLTATRPAAGTLVAVTNSNGVAGAGALPQQATNLASDLGGSGGVDLFSDGTLAYADRNNHRIVGVTPEGEAFLIAGGAPGFVDLTSGPNARFSSPIDLAINPVSGDIYVTDLANRRVRRIRQSDGFVDTIVGGGVDNSTDGLPGPGSGVFINAPSGLGINAAGTRLYVADANNNRILEVQLDDVGFNTTAIVNNSAVGCIGGIGAGTMAPLISTLNDTDIAVDASGRVYFAAQSPQNFNPGTSGCPVGQFRLILWRRELNGDLTPLAGNGTSNADGAAALSSAVVDVTGIEIGAGGDVLFIESDRHRLRRIPGGLPTGLLQNVAGLDQTAGSGSVNLPGATRLNFPQMMVRNAAGDLFIVDAGSGSDAVRVLIGP